MSARRQPHRWDAAAHELKIHFGRELQIASMGLPQREIGRRSGVSQSMVSRIFHGRVTPDLDVMVALSRAVGHRLVIKLYPHEGVRLRDSGQLGLANTIRSQAHSRWRVQLEVPVGAPPDRRAGDMVIDQPIETDLIELERGLFDFQAQLRAAQLKRAVLAERLGRAVGLIIGVPDTPSARRALAPHADLIHSALPVSSRKAWAAIRSGEPVGGDALLWIRKSSGGQSDAGGASDSARRTAPATADAPDASRRTGLRLPAESDAPGA